MLGRGGLVNTVVSYRAVHCGVARARRKPFLGQWGGGERKIWGGAVVPGGALWDDSCKCLLYPSLGYGNRERESKHRQARERLAHCLHDPQPSHRCLCFSRVLEGRRGVRP